jgi:hypothetical protein
MGRERRPVPVVAVGDGRPDAGPEEPRVWRSCEGDGTLGAHSISKAGELEESVQTWLANPVRPAACEGETDAASDATLALCFAGAVVGMAVYGAKAPRHGKGGDVWKMMAENIPDRGGSEDRCFTRRTTMFDTPIALALFAAFLLGVVAGTGMEIIVRGGRH